MCVCVCGDLLAIPSARIAQKELAEVSQQHFFAVVIATSVGILRVGVSRSFLFSNSTWKHWNDFNPFFPGLKPMSKHPQQ